VFLVFKAQPLTAILSWDDVMAGKVVKYLSVYGLWRWLEWPLMTWSSWVHIPSLSSYYLHFLFSPKKLLDMTYELYLSGISQIKS